MAVFVRESIVLDIFAQNIKPDFIATKTEFQKCKTNVQRVNMFLHKQEVFQDLQNCLNQMDGFVSKSDEVSDQFTQTANDFFNDDKYLLAIEKYTQSLVCARTEVVASFAYSHRSAVLFVMGLYAECLTDIERALNHGYPKDLHINLSRRKENVEKMQTVPKNIVNTYEIKESEKNPAIQSARNCIEIRTKKKYGKHIVATRDIEIGEVLIVEKPYTSIVIHDKNIYCHECVECCYNLIPCPHCCFAMYCSETCKEKAFKCYHQYECLIQCYISILFESFKDVLLLALRMTILARNNKNSNADDSTYCSDRYYEISKLERHSNKYSVKHLFVLAYMTSAIFYLLKEKTNIFSEFEDFEDEFKEQFLLNLQIRGIYTAEIYRSYEKYDSDIGIYGNAIYSLCSLFKHSCYPNAFGYNSGSKLIIRALSSIKKGEECFVSYITHCLSADKTTRQALLQGMHHFTCKCKACKENWPTKNDCEIPGKFAMVAKKLAQIDKKVLINHLHKLILDLRKMEETMTEPFDEVFVIRERLRIGYHILDDRS